MLPHIIFVQLSFCYLEGPDTARLAIDPQIVILITHFSSWETMMSLNFLSGARGTSILYSVKMLQGKFFPYGKFADQPEANRSEKQL